MVDCYYSVSHLSLLWFVFTIAKNQMSPEKQATHIARYQKDDAKSLSKQLTSNDHRLNEGKARAYLK